MNPDQNHDEDPCAGVDVETFRQNDPTKMAKAIKGIAGLRRRLSGMDPATPMGEDGRMSLGLMRRQLRLSITPTSVVIETDALRAAIHGGDESVPPTFEGLTRWPSNLAEAGSTIEYVLRNVEAFGVRALGMLTEDLSVLHGNDQGPFGEFQRTQEAAMALASCMGAPFMTTRTLVSGTPWSKAAILYTSTSQVDQMPFLRKDGSIGGGTTTFALQEHSDLLREVRAWVPMSVIVDGTQLPDKPSIDVVPATTGFTTPPSDPVQRLRLSASVPQSLRDALGR